MPSVNPMTWLRSRISGRRNNRPAAPKVKAAPRIDLNCPSCEAMVSLYAEIGDAADSDFIERHAKAQADGNVFVSAYDGDGHLAGVLRARRGDPERKIPGIIYDIAVSSTFRGEKLAQDMVQHLTQEGGFTEGLTGNPARAASSLDRSLAVIRTLYAVALIVGYQKLVEAGYGLFVPPSKTTYRTTLLLLWAMLAVAVLGFRFFWAVGNIRRFVLREVYEARAVRRKRLLLCTMPLLFSHAVLFYCLCRVVAEMCPPHVINSTDVLMFGGLFVALMSCNVSLLLSLRMSRYDKTPDRAWMLNNSIFGLLAFAALIGYWRMEASSEVGLLVLSSLALLNDGLDLWFTGESYLLGDAFGVA